MTDEEIAQLQQELESLRGQVQTLEAEVASKGEAISERDATIGPLKEELETVKADLATKDSQLTEKAVAFEAVGLELSSLKETHARAVAGYKTAVAAANPLVPADLIKGDSIEAINASVGSARAVVEQVKAAIAAGAAASRVPAGAPAREGPALDNMTPREKIQYALSQGKK